MRCDAVEDDAQTDNGGGHGCWPGACGCTTRRKLLKSFAAVRASAVLPAAGVMAQSPSAKPRIVDVHHHPFPPFVVEAYKSAPASEAPLVPGARVWTPAKTLDQMDRNGVAAAIMSISSRLGAIGLSPQENLRMTRMCNDYMAQMMKDHPGRFGFFGYVPLPDVDATLKEIEYCMDVLKADGIGLTTSYGNKWPGDPSFKPVMEELNRRGALVYVHPLAPQCCNRLMSYVQTAYIEYPHDSARAILSLLFSGAFNRQRNIRWIFSHAGGTLPMLAGRVRNLSRRQDLAELAPNGIDEEFRKLYYETANSAYAPTMAALLKFVDISHVMFGTDYPYVTVDENLNDLRSLGLSAAEMRAIERENVIRLLPRLNA